MVGGAHVVDVVEGIHRLGHVQLQILKDVVTGQFEDGLLWRSGHLHCWPS